MDNPKQQHIGVLYGLAAYGIWGCFPLFFSLFNGIPAWEVLIHRIIWAGIFLFILILFFRRWHLLVQAVKTHGQWRRILSCAFLIALNWGLFIYAVGNHRALEASQGYFLTPLINVALGAWILHEQLHKIQWLAIIIAAFAIIIPIIWQAHIPWIGLSLALSFGIYGLIRKQIALDALSGLFLETILLTPFALLIFIIQLQQDSTHFTDSAYRAFLLISSGVLTAIPLLFFTQAAQRLRLATIGFLLYINPTMQFIIALFVLNEKLNIAQLVSFILIWLALAIYSYAALRYRTQKNYLKKSIT